MRYLIIGYLYSLLRFRSSLQRPDLELSGWSRAEGHFPVTFSGRHKVPELSLKNTWEYLKIFWHDFFCDIINDMRV